LAIGEDTFKDFCTSGAIPQYNLERRRSIGREIGKVLTQTPGLTISISTLLFISSRAATRLGVYLEVSYQVIRVWTRLLTLTACCPKIPAAKKWLKSRG
jgi:hypothetical protein